MGGDGSIESFLLVAAAGDEEVAVRGEVYRSDSIRVCLDLELHVAGADGGHHDRATATHHQRPHNPHPNNSYS